MIDKDRFNYDLWKTNPDLWKLAWWNVEKDLADTLDWTNSERIVSSEIKEISSMIKTLLHYLWYAKSDSGIETSEYEKNTKQLLVNAINRLSWENLEPIFQASKKPKNDLEDWNVESRERILIQAFEKAFPATESMIIRLIEDIRQLKSDWTDTTTIEENFKLAILDWFKILENI